MWIVAYIASRISPTKDRDRPSFDELIEALRRDPLQWISTNSNPFWSKTFFSNAALMVTWKCESRSWDVNLLDIHISPIGWKKSLSLSCINGEVNSYHFFGDDAVSQPTEEERKKIQTILELVLASHPKK